MSQTQAAIITQAKGKVSVERQGKVLDLKQGDNLHTGDIINTQNDAVKITFTDGATALLSPQSKLVVQEFSFGAGKEPSFVVKLMEGMMRSVSGELVEQNPDAFKVQTPKATVGIRGTIFITKVNADGSEVHIVLDLDQGHVVTITDHSGNIVTLSRSNQAVFINKSGTYDYEMEEPILTEREIRKLLGDDLSKIILDDFLKSGESTQNTSDVVQKLIESLQESFSAEVTGAALGDTFITLTAEADSESQADSQADSQAGSQNESQNNNQSETTPNSVLREDDNVKPAASFDYFPDGELINTASTHTLVDHNVMLTQNNQAGAIISGDVKSITAGTVHAGDDTITLSKITDGRIVGDADTLSGSATLHCGADSITVDAQSGAYGIYGDAYEALDAAVIYFNDDYIEIQNDFTQAIIVGDAFTIDNLVTVARWDNDTIIVGDSLSGGANIYGDYSNAADVNGGNDSIVVGVLEGSSSIHGGGGDDSIEVSGTMFSGSVNGNAGDDNISLHTMNDGTVNGGLGADAITYSSTIASGHKLNVYNEGGSDSIFITEVADNGEINFFEGDFKITSQSGSGFTMTGGVINCGKGYENFDLLSMTGGVINTNSADDINYLSEVSTGHEITINATADTAKLLLTKGMTGGEVKLTGVGGFSVAESGVPGSLIGFDMSGGTIYASEQTNTIVLDSFSGGTIEGNDGGDLILVTAFSGGTINAGIDSNIEVGVSQSNQSLAPLIDVSKGGSRILVNGNIGNHITLKGFDLSTDYLRSNIGADYAGNSLVVNFAGGDISLSEAISTGATVKINNVWVTFVDGAPGGGNTITYTQSGVDLYADTNEENTQVPFAASLKDNIINIINGVDAGVTVSGDAGNLIFVNVVIENAGKDVIDAKGTDVKGVITGDALLIDEGLFFYAGNDTITVGNLVGSTAVIYGDAQKLENNVTFYNGFDTITVTGTMSGGAHIYGDAGEGAPINVQSGGDKIEVAIMSSDNDENFIYGGTGDDTIDVGEMTSTDGKNFIYGDSQNDTITVREMMRGNDATKGEAEIRGGDGNDVIEVSNMFSNNDIKSSIYGGEGEDTIKVTVTFTGKNSFIYGEAGNDRIEVLVSNDANNDNNIPSIDPGEGNDTIILTAASLIDNYYVKIDKDELSATDVLEVFGKQYTGADLTTLIAKSESVFASDGSLNSITVYFG